LILLHFFFLSSDLKLSPRRSDTVVRQGFLHNNDEITPLVNRDE
jgi:hypothetical protein